MVNDGCDQFSIFDFNFILISPNNLATIKLPPQGRVVEVVEDQSIVYWPIVL